MTMIGSAEFVEATGISYRQLYHWTAIGILTAEPFDGGKGHPKTWPVDQIPVARLMGELQRLGLTDLATLSYVAVRLTVAGQADLELNPNERLIIRKADL